MEMTYIQLGAVILPTAVLILILRDRWQAKLESERHENEARPKGHGFDATGLNARVKSSQSAIHTIPRKQRTRKNHETFSVAMRRSLSDLGFFRDLKERERLKADRDAGI